MSFKDPMPLPKMKEASTPHRRRLRPIEWAAIGALIVLWTAVIISLVHYM